MFEAEDVATYRELVRLQEQLSTEIARDINEIHALLSVLFPECVQVFADPAGKSALVVLKAYRSRQAIAEAEPDALLKLLREQCPGRDARTNSQPIAGFGEVLGEQWPGSIRP